MRTLTAGVIALVMLALPLAGCLEPLQAGSVPGVKEFHLEAKETEVELYPGKTVKMWTFNGEVPGPLIRVREGDLVRVHFWNNHTLPHTVHFHGEHPYAMDGADHQAVPPGGSFTYEFVAKTPGSFVYHCHVDTPLHIPMGLYGQFIVDPKAPAAPQPDAELFAVFSDWNPHHNATPEVYLLNGRAYPSTETFQVRTGDTVRLHVSSMSEVPVAAHLHGSLMREVWPGSQPIDVVPLAHAETRVIEFVATEPGPWMFHDHYEQHLVNDGKYPGGSMSAIEVGEEWWGRFHETMAHAPTGSHRAGDHAEPEAPHADEEPATPAEKGETVAMTGFQYAEPTLTVKAGTTVTWTNEDPAAHTVTSVDGGPLDSGDIAPGASWSYTFDEPGTYKYRCVPHSALGADGEYAGMVATVVVT